MQYWDDVLYPSFRAIIRGEYYGYISQDDMDEECFYLAKRAVATFKFPRISTDYITFYAIRDSEGNLEEVGEGEYPEAILHGYFENDLTSAELEILIAWMKVYWCEKQISNADNFEDMYTDANIKTFSRANAVDKNMKLMAEFRDYARRLETDYSRTSASRTPTIGDVNSDE